MRAYIRVARTDLVDALARDRGEGSGAWLGLVANGDGWLATPTPLRRSTATVRVTGRPYVDHIGPDDWVLALTGSEAAIRDPLDMADSSWRLEITGPREELVPLRRLEPRASASPDSQVSLPVPIRYGRVAGALGTDAWARLAAASITIVGSSRTGSLLARLLVRAGVGHLTLVDPDVLEPHNLDAVGEPDDLGRTKVDTLADELGHLRGRTAIRRVPTDIDRLAAAEAVDASEIVVSCVDNASARSITSRYATAFLRTHLDVGTSARSSADGSRQLGADVRIIGAGQGCLHCVGGLAETDVEPSGHQPFPGGRAGSDPGLNAIAAGTAYRLIGEWLAGRITTTWVRVDGFGMITLPVDAPWCSWCAGRGGGFAALRRAEHRPG